MARGQFAHLPRPGDEHRLALQIAEDLPGQLHRGIAHRDGAAPDAGLGANALGDAEGAGQHVV